jgi:RNA polymerase sigma-70 factor, ECF subfamily
MTTMLERNANGTERSLPFKQPIDALRNGDEAAFSALMTLYYDAMLRTALIYVNDRCVAEDVIQETWIAVLRGLTRFEGRSSLKTWIFSILINRAITCAHREGRYVPLSTLTDTEYDEFEPAVSPDHFHTLNFSESSFYWQPDVQANTWDVIPEDSLLAQETLAHIHAAIRRLPTLQQQVIHLRDVEGRSAAEVCHILGVSEINQRVLLHRARAKVRQIMDRYLRVD